MWWILGVWRSGADAQNRWRWSRELEGGSCIYIFLAWVDIRSLKSLKLVCGIDGGDLQRRKWLSYICFSSLCEGVSTTDSSRFGWVKYGNCGCWGTRPDWVNYHTMDSPLPVLGGNCERDWEGVGISRCGNFGVEVHVFLVIGFGFWILLNFIDWIAKLRNFFVFFSCSFRWWVSLFEGCDRYHIAGSPKSISCRCIKCAHPQIEKHFNH